MNNEHLYAWVKSCQGAAVGYEEALTNKKGSECRGGRDATVVFPPRVSGRGLVTANRTSPASSEPGPLGAPPGKKEQEKKTRIKREEDVQVYLIAEKKKGKKEKEGRKRCGRGRGY